MFVILRFGDHYEWNKVTSCIHNILSGQRWIEHYGEMSIKNTSSDACQCKVTFVKVRRGTIYSEAHTCVHTATLRACPKRNPILYIMHYYP